MTFDKWWDENMGRSVPKTERYEIAKEAWDYQQTIIDELQYLTNLQKDRIDTLESQLEPKLQAYVIRDDKGNIRAYTDDTGRLCIGMLEEQE